MKEDIRQFQAARYALLSEVVLLIAKTTDIQQLQQQLINSLKWVLDFERCTLALLNHDQSSYSLRTLLETRPGIPGVDEPDLPLSVGIPGEVIRTQQMRLVSDAREQGEDFEEPGDPGMEDGSLASILSLPLQAYGKVLGALTFGASATTQLPTRRYQSRRIGRHPSGARHRPLAAVPTARIYPAGAGSTGLVPRAEPGCNHRARPARNRPLSKPRSQAAVPGMV